MYITLSPKSNFWRLGNPSSLGVEDWHWIFKISTLSLQGVWHVAWSRRQPDFWSERLEEPEIMGGFLNSAIRNLYCYFFFLHWCEIRNSKFQWESFKFYSLIIKWISPLCSCIWWIGFQSVLWGPRGCSKVPQEWWLREKGQRERERKGPAGIWAGPLTPHPPWPRAALIFLFDKYWNSM